MCPYNLVTKVFVKVTMSYLLCRRIISSWSGRNYTSAWSDLPSFVARREALINTVVISRGVYILQSKNRMWVMYMCVYLIHVHCTCTCTCVHVTCVSHIYYPLYMCLSDVWLFFPTGIHQLWPCPHCPTPSLPPGGGAGPSHPVHAVVSVECVVRSPHSSWPPSSLLLSPLPLWPTGCQHPGHTTTTPGTVHVHVHTTVDI